MSPLELGEWWAIVPVGIIVLAIIASMVRIFTLHSPKVPAQQAAPPIKKVVQNNKPLHVVTNMRFFLVDIIRD